MSDIPGVEKPANHERPATASSPTMWMQKFTNLPQLTTIATASSRAVEAYLPVSTILQSPHCDWTVGFARMVSTPTNPI